MDLFLFSVKVVLGAMALGIAGPMVYWAGIAFHQYAEALGHKKRLRQSRYLMAQWQHLLLQEDPLPFSAEESGPYTGTTD